MSDELREQLADVQHEIWVHGMEYMFSCCRRNGDYSLTIPAHAVARLLRQMSTDYADLQEREKESDRHQANKVIATLRADQWQPARDGEFIPADLQEGEGVVARRWRPLPDDAAVLTEIEMHVVGVDNMSAEQYAVHLPGEWWLCRRVVPERGLLGEGS